MVTDEELAIKQDVKRVSDKLIESIISIQSELVELNSEIDNLLLSSVNDTLSKAPLSSVEIEKIGNLFSAINRDRSKSIEKYLQQIKELRL